MVTLIRLLAVAAVALTVVFVCLLAYFRAGEKARLEANWSGDGSKEAHINDGLAGFMPRLRRRLMIWVYAVPLSLIAVLSYTPPE